MSTDDLLGNGEPALTITRKSTAYNFIKQTILGQRYLPGQTLVEETIAAELGMSRTPVREALRELDREGLVEATPNRGAVVRSLSAQELLDIFDIKIQLEGMFAGRAAERDGPATAVKLFKALKGMAAAAKTKNRPAYLQADEAYHAAIYEAGQNERARQILNELDAQWHRWRTGMMALEARMETAVEEHHRIAKAIRAGDAKAAERVMRLHLENLRDEIRLLLEDFVTPLSGEQ